MWVGMLLYLLIFWLNISATLSLVCKQHKKPCADWQKGVLLGTPKDIHLNGPIFLVWVIGVPMTWIIYLGLRWFIDCILNWQENIAFRTKLSISISFKNLFSDSPFFLNLSLVSMILFTLYYYQNCLVGIPYTSPCLWEKGRHTPSIICNFLKTAERYSCLKEKNILQWKISQP